MQFLRCIYRTYMNLALKSAEKSREILLQTILKNNASEFNVFELAKHCVFLAIYYIL